MPRVPTTGHLPFPLDHVKIDQQIFFNNESYPQDRKKVDKKVKIRQPYLWDFNISLFTFHYLHFTIYISLFTFHYLHFTIYISLFTFHYLHFTIYISLFTFHYLHFTIYISLFTFHFLHFTFYISLFTFHYLLFTIHFSLFTILKFFRFYKYVAHIAKYAYRYNK